ncbi:MAG: hypothetical protein WC631_02895 [Candidatus Paceibacterota bacterium]|jgi:restriction endonuclease
MNDILKINLLKQYKSLPTEVQKFVLSEKLPSQLLEISNKNKLLIDQAGGLETETTLILLGVQSLKDFVSNLSKNLGIPRDKALIIANDVDTLIFKNIRESLKKISDTVFPEEIPTADKDAQIRNKILSGIENPSTIQGREESISVSSLKSNSANPEYPLEKFANGVEVKKETSMELEIPREAIVPAKVSDLAIKIAKPLHENISPLDNIVEEKLSKAIGIPKEKIIIEESSKLPSKTPEKYDPYKEPIV